MDKLSNGTEVEWRWGEPDGRAVLSLGDARTINGDTVERRSPEQDPALPIEHDSSDKAPISRVELKGIVGEDRHVPPDAVAKVVARGLALREKLRRQGTVLGIARARDLKNRRAVSDGTIRRMAAFFARHDAFCGAEGRREGGELSPDHVAFLLWGGEPGREWAEREKASMDEASGR